MQRFTRFTLLAVLLLLTLAACGGGGTEKVSLSITGDDSFAFDPPFAAVPAGAEVTVQFNNEGNLEHSWVLVPGDADPATVTDSDAINNATTGNVQAQSKASIRFTAPVAGDYLFVCTVPGHAAAGMVGTMSVGDQ